MKNIFQQENVMLQLTFNPVLTLTGFRTIRPWVARVVRVPRVHPCSQGPTKREGGWLGKPLGKDGRDGQGGESSEDGERDSDRGGDGGNGGECGEGGRVTRMQPLTRMA